MKRLTEVPTPQTPKSEAKYYLNNLSKENSATIIQHSDTILALFALASNTVGMSPQIFYKNGLISVNIITWDFSEGREVYTHHNFNCIRLTKAAIEAVKIYSNPFACLCVVERGKTYIHTTQAVVDKLEVMGIKKRCSLSSGRDYVTLSATKSLYEVDYKDFQIMGPVKEAQKIAF